MGLWGENIKRFKRIGLSKEYTIRYLTGWLDDFWYLTEIGWDRRKLSRIRKINHWDKKNGKYGKSRKQKMYKENQ